MLVADKPDKSEDDYQLKERIKNALFQKGVDEEKIHFVGNVMIDTLLKHKALAEKLTLLYDLGLRPGEYATLTMHRPSNVDNPETLKAIMKSIESIADQIKVVFPVHPRTRNKMEAIGFVPDQSSIIFTEPLGYLEFLHLNLHAKMVLTDSGGLQEETTVLGIPCITMRSNTERPITCEVGTNTIVGNDPQTILDAAQTILSGKSKVGEIPAKWDGRAAERIVDVLLELFP